MNYQTDNTYSPNMKNNTSITPERYVFWMNDITVLFRNQNYLKFVPVSDMTRVEQLNAITRFFVYLFILMFMFDKTDEYMYIPLIGIIMVIVLYNVFEIDEQGKKKELIRMSKRTESLKPTQSELNYRTYQYNDNGELITVDIDKEEQEQYEESQNTESEEYKLEAGIYDSAGKLKTGSYKSPIQTLKDKKKKQEIKYSMEDMKLYNDAKCRKPTIDNPFMNASIDDFNTENPPMACNADDEDIQKDIKLKFNKDIYRDIEDVFESKNSQRQFYTVPNNIPNDQEAFARWCYKFPQTCKTDQQRCLNYDDLRIKN